MRLKSCLAALICLLCLYPLSVLAQTEDEKFQKLVDEYLEFSWKLSPISATISGIHQYDDQLESFLFSDVEMRLQQNRKFVERFRTEVDFAKLNESNQIDYDLVFRNLRQQEFGVREERGFETNPGIYPETIAGIGFFMFSREYAPFESRMKDLTSRMEKMPSILDAGRKNLKNPPKLWTSIAIETTRGAIQLYQDVIGPAASGVSDTNGLQKRLKAANQKLITALQAYQNFLEKELLPRSSGNFACGREHFIFRLKNFYLMDETPEEIKATAEKVLQETETQMDAVARKMDPAKKWWEILEEAKKQVFHADQVIPEYKKVTDRARKWVIEKKLASVPEEKLDVVETPQFMRFVIPYAAYFSPAPFEKEQKGFYFVTPVNTSLPLQEQKGQLGELKIDIENTTVHEAYPGHHLQFIHQNQLSKIRRISDSPVMSEGWGLYCERLGEEFGFYSTPVDSLEAWRWLLVRAIRVIVDVGMHCQGMTFEEAVNFMLQHSHLERAAAEGEVRRYTQTPTQPLSYLMGMLMIQDLRKEYQKVEGSAFQIGEFHDRILSYGSVPFRIIRNAMMSDLIHKTQHTQ